MREWTTVDKTGWGDGPWQAEPDKVQWVDPATDLDCLMHRGPAGQWCGYVGVTEEHTLFERVFYEIEADLDVHGGLTYSALCQDTGDESSGICHVPEPGRPHRVWWLGFDTGHAGDYMPAMMAFNPKYADIFRDVIYRDRAYVESEVTHLARQLKTL